MNRDTGRSQTHDCCAASAASTGTAAPHSTGGSPCPVCGGKGKPVKAVTLQSLLKPDAIPRIGEYAYRYCGNPECRIVYYADHGPTFNTDNMAVRVGVKEKNPPRHVCYCFDHTIEDIEQEVRQTGRSTVLDDIKTRMKVACWCETKSPMGSCCLSTVARHVQAALVKHGVPMSSASAPQQQQGAQAMTDQPNQSAYERDCCATSASARNQPAQAPDHLGRWSTPAAVGAAILSSACCWLPLLLLAFGLSAGGVAGFFETVRPFFLAAAVVFLGAGFYFAYFRKPACKPGEACATPNLKLQRFNRAMLWVAAVFVIAFALFPYYSPPLIRAFAGPPAVTAGSGSFTPTQGAEPLIRVYHVQGMTCSACAAGLEVRLAKLPGVAEARVSYDQATATIRSIAGEPGDEVVRVAVERAGFKLADVSPGDGS